MIWPQPLTVRVSRIDSLSATLKRVQFEAADGGELPTAMPGAHVALTLPGKERVFRNAYSLVSHPEARGHYEIIVRRAPKSRGGSAYVHADLRVGDVLRASIPNSQFPIQSSARKHLLIGGGIGITPLLSFLPVLRARQQQVEVHHLARADEVAVFAALLAPFEDPAVHVHASRDACDMPAVLARQPLGTHAYICGPDGLVDGVREMAAILGWPEGCVHSERFGAAGGRPFTLHLQRSQRSIAVGEDESMLDALENAGVSVSSLCRGGACGECVTGVVDGTPEHRDHFLAPDERASGRLVMPCVSRATSDVLTLDL